MRRGTAGRPARSAAESNSRSQAVDLWASSKVMSASPLQFAPVRQRLYLILAELRSRLGVVRLADCHGRMNWPKRGLYFFFEDGELRPDGITPRVVRVGTHAVSRGSKTTLWNRLSTHRGRADGGGGNHRGSIFRLHVGHALTLSGKVARPAADTWGRGSSAPRDIRDAEVEVERAVSSQIRKMPLLWVQADDEPSPSSMRAAIERNAVALLSSSGPAANPERPSADWLGRSALAQEIRDSGLWNVRHTRESCEHAFLDLLESCADRTEGL